MFSVQKKPFLVLIIGILIISAILIIIVDFFDGFLRGILRYFLCDVPAVGDCESSRVFTQNLDLLPIIGIIGIFIAFGVSFFWMLHYLHNRNEWWTVIPFDVLLGTIVTGVLIELLESSYDVTAAMLGLLAVCSLMTGFACIKQKKYIPLGICYLILAPILALCGFIFYFVGIFSFL